MTNFKEMMKILAMVGALFGVVYWCEAAQAQVPWDGTFEADPADGDPVSEGDDNIRESRVEIGDRAEVDLCWGTGETEGCVTGSGTDSGRLREGGGRCFITTGNDPATLGDHDGTGAGSVTDYDNTGGGGDSALDPGRCWYDTQDGSFHVYDGTAWRQQTKTSGNLIYGGSFEQTDLTGSLASTTVPAGWTLSGTPDVSYSATPASEGGGAEATVTATVSADEGIQQTLTGAGGLKPSTNYLIVGRVQPQVATDSCTIRTTGGATNVTLTQSTGTAYVTLAGYIATDATPTAIVVIAEADVATDACSLDHIAVFELGNLGQHQPGAVLFEVTDTTTVQNQCGVTYEATAGCSDLLSMTVEPPGPGYMVLLVANVAVNPDNESCWARIARADTTLVGEGSAFDRVTARTAMITATTWEGPLTPGTPITYEVDVRTEGTAECDVVCDEANGCTHRAILIPTR